MEKFRTYYDLLNNEQKKAVDIIDGPLLVLAGPGTGKTQLLSVRAANIIKSKKALSENILILTFTNAAVRAMRSRLADIMGDKGYEVEVDTFHTFANSIVLGSEHALKYVKDKIDITSVERVKAISYIMDNTRGLKVLRPFGSPYHYCDEIIMKISELKNEGISPIEFKENINGLVPQDGLIEEKDILRLTELAGIYQAYEKLKNEESEILFDKRGRKDYDDMILIALEAMRNDKSLRDDIAGRYKYIMVDEYQDTNGAQLELLFSMLGQGSANICCVGDDDQAIYRFQGATLANFEILKEKLKPVKIITLKDNYRSSDTIVAATGMIINALPLAERIEAKELGSKRSYKNSFVKYAEFSTNEEELAFIISEIKKQADVIKEDKTLTPEERSKPFNNIAVLVRKRSQILYIIDAFLKRGIPYATDGSENIANEKRVRQMLDVLDIAWGSPVKEESPKSASLYRVLTADYIGANHSDILKLLAFINDKKRALKEKNKNTENESLFNAFLEHFSYFNTGKNGQPVEPTKEDSENLAIAKLLKLSNPWALHKAAWAISGLLKDASSRPIHDILLGYIESVKLYNYILTSFKKEKVIKIRDLRALTSFINMIKQSDLSTPGLRLEDFMEELALKKLHGLAIEGTLATENQDGVRLYTAHKSKGLEFYSVFIPFCLDKRSWPNRGKYDSIRVPPEVYKRKEIIKEKEKHKLLDLHDELRLFYVASSRAKSFLCYTATPEEKVIRSPFLDSMNIKKTREIPLDEEKFLVELLKQSPAKDPFINTEDILRDMVSRLTLNPTGVNNYIYCKRRFLYDNVLMLPARKNQQLTFGNCAHKAMEEVYSDYMESRRFPVFESFKTYFKDELAYQGVNSSIKKWCLDKLNTLSGWYAKESKEPIMPLALENKLEINLGDGVSFRGAFDKIEDDGKGGIRVIDYKTGNPYNHIKDIHNHPDLKSDDCDDYFRQLVAYKLLYDRSHIKPERDKKVSQGVLDFLEPVGKTVKKYGLEEGKYVRYSIDLNDSMTADLERIIIDLWVKMNKLEFEKLPERDNDKCSKCDYESICWVN